MKTLEIMQMAEADLAPKLKTMKLKELERHAQKILHNLGQPDFDEVMLVLIRALPKLDSSKIDKLSAVKNLVRGLVPTASNDSVVDDELIERLSVLLTVLISKKFQKILSDT